jgi:tRNA G18 (ribose-2'-O)-methylase SpoU
MGGYFGIGVEKISKQMNAGSLFRTAHAFGASFVFTIAQDYSEREGGIADTSKTPGNLPLHAFEDVAALRLPVGCELIGIELLDDAIELPRFRHPRCAAYVLGRERGSLSPEILALCGEVVKIPTKFAVNLAVAGAIVMYDRLVSSHKFGARPLMPGGPVEPPPPHVFGPPTSRRRTDAGAREKTEKTKGVSKRK